MKPFRALRARRTLRRGFRWNEHSFTALEALMDSLEVLIMRFDKDTEFNILEYLFCVRFTVEFLKENPDRDLEVEFCGRVARDLIMFYDGTNDSFLCHTGDLRRSTRAAIAQIHSFIDRLAPQGT